METIKARPVIANEAMALANTEYSYELPIGTRAFWIKLRNPGYPLKLCVVEGNSGVTYVNVPQGETYIMKNMKGWKMILYFQTTKAGQVAEILTLK